MGAVPMVGECGVVPRVGTVGKLLDLLVPLVERLAFSLQEDMESVPDVLEGTTYSTGDDVRRMSDELAQVYTFSVITAAHDYGMDVLSPGFGEDMAVKVQSLTRVYEMVDVAAAMFPESVGEVVCEIKTVISGTDWTGVESSAGKSLNRHLYEDFLARHDSSVRDATGSYYTPDALVQGMVNLVSEVACEYGPGLANSVVVDPAMGTGAFPLAMVDRVADDARGTDCPEDIVGRFAGNMHGWELQLTPFSIAHSSIVGRLRELGVTVDPALEAKDSLVAPESVRGQSGSGLLGRGHRAPEGEFSTDEGAPFYVIGGNPPYDSVSLASWPWVYDMMTEWRENSEGGRGTISNLYTAFLRMMCWRAWEDPDAGGGGGVVYMVAPSSWLHDKGGTGIRDWVRRMADRVWVVNITPEGWMHPNNVFPIATPVAVFIAQRGANPKAGMAGVFYREVTIGSTKEQRMREVLSMRIHDSGWEMAVGNSFIPGSDMWKGAPTVDDIFLIANSGISWNRKWAVTPSWSTLLARLQALKNAEPQDRPVLFKECRAGEWDAARLSSPGMGDIGVMKVVGTPLAEDESFFEDPAAISVVDTPMCRSYGLGDTRAINATRSNLWGSTHYNQDNVFLVSPAKHDHTSDSCAMVTKLVPRHFIYSGRASGERVHPTYHPDGTPNTAPGLLEALSAHQEVEVSPNDVAAYVVAIMAHPGYHERFKEDLRNPIVRVPLTADPALWAEAVELGRIHVGLTSADLQDSDAPLPSAPGHSSSIKWVAEHGEGAISGNARLMCRVGEDGQFRVGGNVFTGVDPRIMGYKIGGSKVVVKWLERHLATPYGKTMTPLDLIMPDSWEPGWSQELYRLLLAVEALVALEPLQDDLLGRITEGELLSKGALTQSGVRWPGGRKDPMRKARWPGLKNGVGLL